MKRINDREVELTEMELQVVAMFDAALANGASIKDAATEVIADVCFDRPDWMKDGLTDRFVQYLSDGTLRWRAESCTLIVDGE